MPFKSDLKKPACASKRDLLELATLQYTVIMAHKNGLFCAWRDFNKTFCAISTYRIVASTSPSRFEAHVGLFRLLMKGIFDPYVL